MRPSIADVIPTTRKAGSGTFARAPVSFTPLTDNQYLREPGSCFHTEDALELMPGTIPWFMIHYEPFFAFLREKAQKDGLSRISDVGRLGEHTNQYGLLVRGPSSDMLVAKISSLLIQPPNRFFVLGTRELGARVVSRLDDLIHGESGQKALLGRLSESVFLDLSETDIHVCAKNGRGQGTKNLALVFEKIEFWVEQSGYDTFLQCIICGEQHNGDEGVLCQSGHFYCCLLYTSPSPRD